ncbi:CU044_2847 family protein [Actinomadura rubrisoli]|uniref:CU044_2847 family protein n=1 Tax=Actinomadura rubrisoli TaxID=2530368 RepID=UPI001404E06B|nr:CU044_2847 family protein [Actinomadura rubrisoli]
MDDGLVEITLPNGQMMMASVTRRDPGGGPQDVGFGRPKSFDAVTETLQGIGIAIIGALDNVKPSRASVEFGLELAVKGGKLVSVFVDADTKASLKVVLEWERGRGEE